MVQAIENPIAWSTVLHFIFNQQRTRKSKEMK